MDSGEQRSATPGTKTGLATQTAQSLSVQDTNCDDSCSSARGVVQICLQTDIVELNALRCEIQQLQGCDNDASASLACLRRVQNETF